MLKLLLINSSARRSVLNCIFSSLASIMLFSQVYCQTFSINGRITASRIPVRNASVTFIDMADTSRKFSALTDSLGYYHTDISTSVKSVLNTLPTKFDVGQNYPNPFSTLTAIPYVIEKESNIRVTIFDILGRTVRKFDIGKQNIGPHNILWDGANDFGTKVANGIYFYRLDAGGQTRSGKMIFNKGGNNLVSIPLTAISGRSLLKTNSVQNIQGNTFTARIENTSTTSPTISPNETTNLIIDKDTTFNFLISYIPLAVIDPDSSRQYIRGFGASNIILWRPDMTDSEIQTAFGTGDGQIGFTILRIMIEPDSNRWSLYVPTAQKAQALGAIVIASPWNAPENMIDTTGGVQRVNHAMYAQYAAHLNSFNAYMTNHGVTIYGISVQNEPDITDQWTTWTSGEIFDFVRNYSQAITGTYVMAPESFHFNRTYSDPILNDSLACANTDIICGHIYGGGLGQYPLAESKGKEVWMTEFLSGENSQANDLTWSVSAAKSISDAMSSNMNAYVWWYIVRFYGPISDGMNGSGNKGDVTKKGYMMSQFSKFVRPGYYRIKSTMVPAIAATSVVTAYKDPGTSKIIIVAVNTGTSALVQNFRFQNGASMVIFSPYTTSGTKNVQPGDDIIMENGNFTYTLEPQSVTTFISN